MPTAELVVGTDGGHPFSKSTAVNDAFTRSSGDVLVVADADALISTEDVLRAVAKAVKTKRLVMPYTTESFRLTEEGTRALLALDPTCDVSLGDRKPTRRNGPPQRTAGGVYTITRESFLAVQGMDPRFRGWGYEDVSFFRACNVLLGSPMHLPGTLRLMWHPYPKNQANHRVWDDDDGKLNEVLRTHYLRATTPADMLRLVNEHKLGEEPVPVRPLRAVKPGSITIREQVFDIPGQPIRI